MVAEPGAEKTGCGLRLLVRGTVQGVGFRPFVYHSARKHGLRGQVLNTSRGVIIDVEGPPEALAAFTFQLRTEPPRLALIESVEEQPRPFQGYLDFRILDSLEETEREATVPADVATCDECRRDVFDPSDRHYRYPFTNCTNCGPRFTLVRDIPYDRSQTSMAAFPMCELCKREYRDPNDRRFHAQPVACPLCGPQIEMVDWRGDRIAGPGNWLEAAWRMLMADEVLAVKGLGGFHLACNAVSPSAVEKMRRRKGRDSKPFAVMARDLAFVRRFCKLSGEEEALLTSSSSPIVLLERLPQSGLPEALSPGLRTLGVMLPYTPLHLLLMSGPLPLLVMTSGNLSELPLVKDNEAALRELSAVTRYFIWHDRPIVNRCDDSVTYVAGGEPRFIRRSRGYVPQGIIVPRFSKTVVLGIGGEMKNAFCLLKREYAFMSQHIGEMEHVEGEEFLKESLDQWSKMLAVVPEVVGFDLHPDYHSSQLARSLPAALHVGVQHHHAHLVSCLAENRSRGPAIGLILDGTGCGTDGSLWGFEVLTADYYSFERRYHLRCVPLPGGEAAVRHPWRNAVSYLLSYLGERGENVARSIWGAEKPGQLEAVIGMVRSGFNSPPACGCGRLFDAVAAILGLGDDSTYEGQLAAELGELVDPATIQSPLEPYSYSFDADQIDAGPLLEDLLADYWAGTPRDKVSRRFHDTLVVALLEAVRRVAQTTGLNEVALSGGTWQNHYLFNRTKAELKRAGFTVYSHRQLPANDGGIALGQALVADRRWAAGVPGSTDAGNRG